MNPLLIRRRGMMQAQGGGLPYDAEVEYLEANNPYETLEVIDSTHIDTGIYPTPYTSLEIKYSMNDDNIQRRICGCYGDLVYIIYTNGTKRIANSFADNSNDARNLSVILTANSIYDVLMNADNLKTSVNGTVKITRTVRPNNTATFTMKLFAATDNQYQANGRIYYCKLWNTSGGVDTMLRDFVPVRVGTVGYMYDRVSGQLFGNQGTGDFILGPDVQ